MAIDYKKHIWEGWTVEAFIKDLSWQLETIQSGRSIFKKIETKAALKKWCMENQPGYKKYIPEVVQHFAELYNLK